jgi:hypothetical protein
VLLVFLSTFAWNIYYPEKNWRDIMINAFRPFTQCFRKATVHLQKVLEVMSTSICIDLNPFNFVRKHLSSDGLPILSVSNTEPVSRNFWISLRNALRWVTGVSGNFSANCSWTKSLYLLPSRKIYPTRKTGSSIERTNDSKTELNNYTLYRYCTSTAV